MKQLVLARHAKSSWKVAGLDDHERPLNDRGRRNAPEMGRRLWDAGFRPDVVVTSTARRALDTAELLARSLNYDVAAIEPEAELYACSPREWLRVIRALPASCNAALIVGHNPEITELCLLLAPLQLDNVPTCGMLCLDYAIEEWRAIPATDPTAWRFDYPKRKPQADGD